jgi:glycosyltransferase involved in cell wall biosynthesis
MKPGMPDPAALLKLMRLLRRHRPALVQTWMYHADLLGGLAARLAGRIPVVWGIHQASLAKEGNKKLTLFTIRLCAKLSGYLPDRIICCSKAALEAHSALGYARDRMVMIPNGFDLGIYKPDPAARASVRAELDLAGDAVLVGLFARFHVQKDHRTFISAARKIHAVHGDVHFVLCGDGIDWNNPVLADWIASAGLNGVVHLLSHRNDVPRLMAAMDIVSLSSFAEAFPNVVGEAMACGVPCVVTDTGDSALLIGETGLTVPPRDPERLADAWLKMLAMNAEMRQQQGKRARERIAEHFSLPAIVARYESLYEEVLLSKARLPA